MKIVYHRKNYFAASTFVIFAFICVNAGRIAKRPANSELLRFDIPFPIGKNRVDPASAFLKGMIRKTAKRLSEKIMQTAACTANGHSTARPSSRQAND
jgi:hypothetical protein